MEAVQKEMNQTQQFNNLLNYLGTLNSDDLNKVLDKCLGILEKSNELIPKFKERVQRYQEEMNQKYLSEIDQLNTSYENNVDKARKEALKAKEKEYNDNVTKIWIDIKTAVNKLVTHLVEVNNYKKEDLKDWTFAIWRSNTGEKRLYINDGNPYEKDTLNMAVFYITGSINHYPKQLVSKHINIPVSVYQEIADMFDDELPLKRFGDVFEANL